MSIKNLEENFTRYEIARILGARALQIAMDAPLLLKISEERLKELRFDALKIAEEEFKMGVLPISISRPSPRRGRDKLSTIKDEEVSDEELIKKEKEIEKEIQEDLSEYSLVQEGEESIEEAEPSSSEEQ